MILVNSDWSRIIDFENSKVNTLVIENIEYFRSIVRDLMGQIDGVDGKFSLSHENKNLELSKSVFSVFINSYLF